MKSTLILSILALTSSVIAGANPPACLLAAVNTEKSPVDLNTVCGSDAKKVQAAIASLCNSDTASVAQSAFAATCSAAGKTVASYTASATKSSGSAKSSSSAAASSSATTSYSGTFVYTTAVYNSSCDCTQTFVTSATAGSTVNSVFASATNTASASAAGSATGSASSAVGTGAAAPRAENLGSFAAAAIAIAGVVAAL